MTNRENENKIILSLFTSREKLRNKSKNSINVIKIWVREDRERESK